MSKKVIFSVLDSASGAYGNPFFLPHVGVALRSLSDAVNGGEGDIAKHPQDFQLFELGEFDDASGEITPLAKPKHITHAASLKNS